jgi:hypothetical protein
MDSSSTKEGGGHSVDQTFFDAEDGRRPSASRYGQMNFQRPKMPRFHRQRAAL